MNNENQPLAVNEQSNNSTNFATKQAKAKLIKTAILNFFILGVLIYFISVTTSLSWFYSSKQVNSNMQGLSVSTPPEIDVNIEFFEADSAQDGKVYFKPTSNFQMPKYSILNNTPTKLLMKLTISSENLTPSEIGNYKFSVLTDTTYFMNGETEDTKIADTNENIENKSQNKLTSIINFKYFETVNTGNYVDDTNAEVSNAYYVLDNQDGVVSFIEKDQLVPYMATNELNLVTNGNLTEFFVVMDYDIDNISYLMGANIGNDALMGEIDQDRFITFGCDFTFKISF